MSQVTDYSLANASGAALRADANNVLDAIKTQNSGSSAPSNTSAGMPWYDTSNGIYKVRDAANTAWLSLFKVTSEGVVPFNREAVEDGAETAFTSTDTTPTVAGATRFVTANASSTSISDFDDPVDGQDIWVRVGDANTTLVHASSKLELIAGQNVLAVSGDLWHFRNFSGVWKQLPDGLGMGLPGVVRITPNAIGDWGSEASTSDQAVDLSDDGIPKGAREALVEYTFYSSSSAYTASFKDYAGTTIGQRLIPVSSAQNFNQGELWVPLDASARFKMAFSGTWTAVFNTGKAIAYRV